MQIFNKRKQTGGMLIETIAGVAILGAVAIGAANLMEQSANEAKAAAAAQQLKTFGDATSAFIKQNQGAILNLIKQKRESGIDDQPVINITPVELTNAALLPAGFNSNNSYGQQTCALVTEIKEIKIISGVPTEVPSGRLSGLVIAENTPASTMDEVTAATIANMVGANGGRVITGLKIAGARNAWNLNALETAVYDDRNFNYETGDSRNCVKGTNNNGVNIQRNNLVLALWLGNANGSINQDVLYRVKVSGRNDLNKMDTTLGVMDNAQLDSGFAINVTKGNINVAAGNVNISGDLKASTLEPTFTGALDGTNCSSYASGTLATDNLGNLFSCVNNLWKKSTVDGDDIKVVTGIGSGVFAAASCPSNWHVVGASCSAKIVAEYKQDVDLPLNAGFPEGGDGNFILYKAGDAIPTYVSNIGTEIHCKTAYHASPITAYAFCKKD